MTSKINKKVSHFFTGVPLDLDILPYNVRWFNCSRNVWSHTKNLEVFTILVKISIRQVFVKVFLTSFLRLLSCKSYVNTLWN
jgi:hypothetical protein